LGVVIIIALLAVSGLAKDELATIAGSNAPVPIRHKNGKLLIEVEELSRHFGWEAKRIAPGRMIALCRRGRDEMCVPISLDGLETLDTLDGLFVEATALERIVGFEVRRDAARATLVPSPAGGQAEVPAYHASWGAGRGFAVGQTVPDIPLFDLEGKEVRFSEFLGKRYIIYCWASW
jgi:hypothetical protein